MSQSPSSASFSAVLREAELIAGESPVLIENLVHALSVAGAWRAADIIAGGLAVSDDTRSWLSETAEFARSIGHNFIGTEHLMYLAASELDTPWSRLISRTGLAAPIRREVALVLSDERYGTCAGAFDENGRWIGMPMRDETGLRIVVAPSGRVVLRETPMETPRTETTRPRSTWSPAVRTIVDKAEQLAAREHRNTAVADLVDGMDASLMSAVLERALGGSTATPRVERAIRAAGIAARSGRRSVVDSADLMNALADDAAGVAAQAVKLADAGEALAIEIAGALSPNTTARSAPAILTPTTHTLASELVDDEGVRSFGPNGSLFSAHEPAQ